MVQIFYVFEQVFFWEVGSTDLLSDPTSFASLNVSLSKFVEDKCFASVHVPEDTDDRAP